MLQGSVAGCRVVINRSALLVFTIFPRRWQDVEPRDEVLRVVAKPILLPPLISCCHQHRGRRITHVNCRTCSQDDCSQVVSKKGAEIVPSLGGNRAEGSSPALLLPSMSADPLLRITQLEQNIRFLHEQHQLMLTSLHQEIETLRQRNRDLQFQLVFTKKNAVYGQHTSSESSPDDEGKSKVVAGSPNHLCNTQNLQVEMLERDVTDLRTALNELTIKNNNLSKTLDEQSKSLEKAVSLEIEYKSRLEDADKLIRRLRRENEDQRHEMNLLRTQLNNKSSSSAGGGRHNSAGSGGGSRRGGGGGGTGGRERDGGNSRDNNGVQDNNSSQHHGLHRFPPLHTQQYWQRSRQQSTDCCPGNTSGANGDNPSSLPHLQQRHHYNCQQNKGNHHGGNGRYYSNGSHNNHHHYYSNNRGNRGGSGGGGNSQRLANSGTSNKREQSQ
ncbi:uncharacterized protein LOC142324099 isoform X2 [Lycorma delicatula]|uniref:uncharacterized protein LOC142324099 isoform X2 n=1 Tax=Lycorma delicatula TaxID=130591 RepID=UPI003F512BDB